MLHKQEADELGAQLQKIVDTERKADQIGRRLTVKRGVYLWGLRACWWVPFIKFALMQIINGDLPTPITIHMLFYIGSSARWLLVGIVRLVCRHQCSLSVFRIFLFLENARCDACNSAYVQRLGLARL